MKRTTVLFYCDWCYDIMNKLICDSRTFLCSETLTTLLLKSSAEQTMSEYYEMLKYTDLNWSKIIFNSQ